MPSNQPGGEQENYTTGWPTGWLRSFGMWALVGVLWLVAFGAAHLNYLPAMGSQGISLWYLPAGVTVGAAMALGGSTGIAVAVAASAKSLFFAEPLLEHAHGVRHALVFALVGVIFRRLNGPTWPLSKLKSSGLFVAVAILGSGASASLGVMLNAVAFGGARDIAWQALPSWIVGDAIGVLTIAPLILIAFGGWRKPDAAKLSFRNLAGSIGFVVACNFVAFGLPALLPTAPALWFLAISAPIVVAIIYGSAPAMIAVAATNLLFPPFAGLLTPGLDRFEQQLFLLMVSLTGLLLGSALGERDCALLALQERERTLEREVEARTQEIKQTAEQHVRMLASLSHDLRQPVQALSLYLEILGGINLPQAAKGPAARSLLLAARLRDLVQTVLGLSRNDPRARSPNRRAFPIQDAFERLAAALAPLAGEHHIDLAFVPSSQIINSDPVMLDRMLGNLIENAIRHSGGGRVLVGCRRRAGNVAVHVIDNGQGFGLTLNPAPTAFPSISSGSGLGLRIVADAAMALGHSVEFLPQRHGAHITLTLPAMNLPLPKARTSPASVAPVLFGSALVIEDDPQVRDALAMTLRNAGMSVTTAASHSEALSEIAGREHQADLLILDYQLPSGRHGTDTYRMAERIVGRALPAIFVTGSTEPSDLAVLRALGWPVLSKPVSAELLLEAARAAIKKRNEPTHSATA